jgi:hypothetical protein
MCEVNLEGTDMETLFKTAALLFLAIGLAGFDGDAPGMGGGDGYWIEQRSTLHPDRWDKVALVFGSGDQRGNGIMCNAFIEAMRIKVSDAPAPAHFRCVRAN